MTKSDSNWIYASWCMQRQPQSRDIAACIVVFRNLFPKINISIPQIVYGDKGYQ